MSAGFNVVKIVSLVVVIVELSNEILSSRISSSLVFLSRFNVSRFDSVVEVILWLTAESVSLGGRSCKIPKSSITEMFFPS